MLLLASPAGDDVAGDHLAPQHALLPAQLTRRSVLNKLPTEGCLPGARAPSEHKAAQLAVILLLGGVQDLGDQPLPGDQAPVTRGLCLLHH